MTPENFIYWLQGMLEGTEGKAYDLMEYSQRERMIRDHLKLVMKKETPNYTPTPGTFPPYTPPTNPFDDRYKVIC